MIWVISNQLHISLWGVCLGIDPHLYFSPGFFQMLSFLIWNVQSFINPKFINQWYLKIWILGSTAIKQCLLSCPYHWLINFGLSCPYHFSDHFRKHSYLSCVYQSRVEITKHRKSGPVFMLSDGQPLVRILGFLLWSPSIMGRALPLSWP